MTHSGDEDAVAQWDVLVQQNPQAQKLLEKMKHILNVTYLIICCQELGALMQIPDLNKLNKKSQVAAVVPYILTNTTGR